MTTDEIFFEALKADTGIMQSTEGRIFPTCIEVPPMDQDKTKMPYVIIMNNGFTNTPGDKDVEWEDDEDSDTTAVEISASSQKEVTELTSQIRMAISGYITQMNYDERPRLTSLTSSGIAWDWTKPCYFQTLTYQCKVNNQTIQDHAE